MVGERRAPRRWTQTARDAFVDALAESCNVRKSALAAGMDPRRAYALRLRDSEFAAQWDAALAMGYARVEEKLIRDAIGEGDDDGAEGEGNAAGESAPKAPPMSKYDRELALNLLKFHQGAVGRAHAGGTPPRRATEAETDAAILAKLAALKRRLARK